MIRKCSCVSCVLMMAMCFTGADLRARFEDDTGQILIYNEQYSPLLPSQGHAIDVSHSNI